MSGKRNWADLMGKGLAYVVLRKGNRVQVLVGPTDKQLRRRGRRGWRVTSADGPRSGSGRSAIGSGTGRG